MKKRDVFIALFIILLLLMIAGIFYHFMNNRTYKLNLPEAEKLESISLEQDTNEKVILYIKDNGIGIKKGEITRVFEKGFTGTNGRLSNKKSTGIGLYLCRKLCDKLGIAIELNSIQNEGTEIRLVFPKSSYIDIG